MWRSSPCGFSKGLDHPLFLTHENGLRALSLGTHLDRHGPQPYAEAHGMAALHVIVKPDKENGKALS